MDTLLSSTPSDEVIRARLNREFQQAEWKQEQKDWKAGRELSEDLAAHLRASRDGLLCYTETALGGDGFTGGIADVYAIKPRWGAKDIRVYEVKSSRADFVRGLKEDQHTRYFPFCRRFYFACPSGVIKKADLPEGCGLITRTDNGWRTAVVPTPRDVPEPGFDFMVGLLDRRLEGWKASRNLRDRIAWKDNATLHEHAQHLGHNLGVKFRDAERNPELSVEEQNRLFHAARLYDRVMELAKAAGVQARFRWNENEAPSADDVEQLARFAVSLISEADKVRRIGKFLDMMPARLGEEVGSILNSS